MATTTTEIVPSRTYRQNQSPFTSPWVDWPAGAISAELRCASTTFTNPANVVSFRIEESRDGGTTPRLMAEATDMAGGFNRDGSPRQPGIKVSLGADEISIPRKVRAIMSVVGQITGPMLLTTETL